jgi:hypothetical protein
VVGDAPDHRARYYILVRGANRTTGFPGSSDQGYAAFRIFIQLKIIPSSVHSDSDNLVPKDRGIKRFYPISCKWTSENLSSTHSGE